jgi:type IV pilus assembly protein PilA
MNTNKRGFTLLEILLVIGIIATLALVVVVALDPGKRFEDARNARRLSDIQSILSAVQQYMVDSKGTIPDGIIDSQLQIGDANGGCELGMGMCSDPGAGSCLNLAPLLARYLKEMPYDPQNASTAQTHYAIKIDANHIVTVTACDSTDATISSVSR